MKSVLGVYSKILAKRNSDSNKTNKKSAKIWAFMIEEIKGEF